MLSTDERKNLAKATVIGTIWSYASKYSGKLMVFISTLILARLLSQEDFGVAGYALVFISFIDVLQGLGINPALVYYDLDEKRTETAFWLGIGVGVLLGVLTYLLGPLAGAYFRDPLAVPVTQALAVNFPIQGLVLIHDAILRKEMSFGKRFAPEFVRSIVKGVVSIAFALNGFGYWSLIYGQIASSIANTLSLIILVPWRPKFIFSTNYARPLLVYGGNIVIVNILGIILLNSDYLVVGRYLGSAALGVYTLAFRVPDLLINQFCVILAQVVFPAYARMKHDLEALTRGFLQTMRYVALITTPMGLGLALVARPFIIVAFGWEWLDAVAVIPWIAAYTVIRSYTFNIGDVYKAQGRPKLLTALSVFQTFLLVPAMLWAVLVPQSIEAVGWMRTAVELVSFTINIVMASRMLHTSPLTMLNTLRPAFVGSFVMTIGVLLTQAAVTELHALSQLLILVSVGAICYGAALWVVERKLMLQLVQLVQKTIGRKA